jgi:hypothetical protein
MSHPPSPTRGSPQRRRRAVLVKPDPGHGSRGAPFGSLVAQQSAPRLGGLLPEPLMLTETVTVDACQLNRRK